MSGEEPAVQPCPRCGVELGLVRAAGYQAALHQHRARAALAAGRQADAVRHATAAVHLVDAPATRRTLAAALIAAGVGSRLAFGLLDR